MSRSISINSEIVSLKPQRASLTRHCKACLRNAMACSSDASRIISVHLSLSGGSSKPISMAAFYPKTGCSGLSDTGLGSVQINSRAVSAASVDIHVCLVCRLFPLMRLDRLNLGAPIDRVFVHCSKPVFSKFGASAAVGHGRFYRRGCDSPRTASGPLRGIFEVEGDRRETTILGCE